MDVTRADRPLSGTILHLLPGHLLPQANAVRALQTRRHMRGLLPLGIAFVASSRRAVKRGRNVGDSELGNVAGDKTANSAECGSASSVMLRDDGKGKCRAVQS